MRVANATGVSIDRSLILGVNRSMPKTVLLTSASWTLFAVDRDDFVTSCHHRDVRMSSISAQGVVERASAELSKRINGLGLRGSKHHSAKGSVMERVTNVFCGGSNAAVTAPEKPSRLLPGRSAKGTAANSAGALGQKKQRPAATYLSWDQLMMDERFLTKFFLYFSACERCVLARVCTRWRDILYRSPRYWSGLVPVLQCREMRGCQGNERARLYSSLLRRGFHSLCLMGASDEDALDLVNTFPLASKHIHTLSLRCSSITDRGLESLLDHLQVSLVDTVNTYVAK